MHRDRYYAIDPFVLLKAVGEDMDSFRRLSGTFLRIAPSTLARLEETVAANDNAKAALTVHSFKGTAALVGANRLIKIIEAVEYLCKRGDMDSIAALLPALTHEFGTVMLEVQASIIDFDVSDSGERSPLPRKPG
jgi:HPt (histidine-containing phosphotransfer) domain-containing protein